MTEEMPPPGRERDEQIAKALGWTRISLSYRVFSIGLAPDANNMAEVPEYSTTNACMELLAYVREQGAEYRLEGNRHGKNEVRCEMYEPRHFNGAEGKDEAAVISETFLLWMRARERA